MVEICDVIGHFDQKGCLELLGEVGEVGEAGGGGRSK